MSFDYIVVGAGSAGSIIASRLTEDSNVNVLLLEAGNDYEDLDSLPDGVKNSYFSASEDVLSSEHNWGYVAKGTRKYLDMPVPRGKVTGGSSAINAQIFLRGEADDYDRWAKWGSDEWSYEKCLPYFRKLETDTDFPDDFHGTEGPIVASRFKPEEWTKEQAAFRQACLDYGFPEAPDHNNPNSTGIGPLPLNSTMGVRISTAMGHLNQARDRDNLTIMPNSLIRKVIFNGKKATGVEVEQNNEIKIYEAPEIILSAGAVASPQILLLSGVGPQEHLEEMGIPVVHSLPGVGKNLRDHPAVFLTWNTKGEDPEIPPVGFQFSCRYTAEGSDLRNDMMIIMCSIGIGHVRTSGYSDSPPGLTMIAHLYLALSQGELHLQSTDPKVQPFLDHNMLDHEFDRTRVREQLRISLELAKTPQMSEFLGELRSPTWNDLSSDEKMDDWILRESTTGHHISGTCKMGPYDDGMAVVNQYGRVHGLQGIRVADASIMPDCIRANTNVPTMMIGERMSDLIKSSTN